MKKIIIILVVLIAVGIFISKDKKAAQPVVTGSETPSTAIAVAGVSLADGTYAVAPTDASISWSGRKVVLKNWIDKGTIGLKEASLEVKDGKIVSNKFVIDMTTIAAGSTGSGGGEDKLSGHLKSEDFFNVALFPSSTFVAKEFTAGTTTGSFVIKGDLTIKDKTNVVAIPATFTVASDGTISAKGSVDIDRTLWDVRYGSGKFFSDLGDKIIDDMFNVSFEVKMKTVVELE